MREGGLLVRGVGGRRREAATAALGQAQRVGAHPRGDRARGDAGVAAAAGPAGARLVQGGRVRRRGLAGARVRPHGAAVFPRRKCRVESQLEVFEVQRAGRVERHAAEPDWASWAPHGLLGRRREGPHRGRGQPDRDGHSWPTAPGSPGVPWYSCPRLLWRRGVRRHSVGWRRRGAPHALGWQYVHFQVDARAARRRPAAVRPALQLAVVGPAGEGARVGVLRRVFALRQRAWRDRDPAADQAEDRNRRGRFRVAAPAVAGGVQGLRRQGRWQHQRE
mmetsp:Transcript_59714/g.169678  ORF Transcript_59714/g.169678 Transcript_59714/m.169678 type:complete len:277 (-) Transcript_59714:653-1483(-)